MRAPLWSEVKDEARAVVAPLSEGWEATDRTIVLLAAAVIHVAALEQTLRTGPHGLSVLRQKDARIAELEEENAHFRAAVLEPAEADESRPLLAAAIELAGIQERLVDRLRSENDRLRAQMDALPDPTKAIDEADAQAGRRRAARRRPR